MAFERTKSGQQNRATFFGVDFICYVEGGGGARDASYDMTFWETVIGSVRPELKIRYTPRGGKPILETLANQIVAENINDTLVAMDSDYDDYRNRKIIDRRILYTHGYSWENDVYGKDNLLRVYSSVCHCGPPSQDVRQMLQDDLIKLQAELKAMVRADFYALCRGTSVVPRESPGRVVEQEAGSKLPTVKKDQVLVLTAAANRRTKSRPIHAPLGPPADTLRYSVGKVIAFSARLLLKATADVVEGVRLTTSHDHLADVALLTFPAVLRAAPPGHVATHHIAQCGGI